MTAKRAVDPAATKRNATDWFALRRPVPNWTQNRAVYLRCAVGVLIFELRGRIQYIGVAASSKGCNTQIRAFARKGNSGRRHYAGRMIHQNRDRLDVLLIVTGASRRAAGLAKLLHAALVENFNPPWNVTRWPRRGVLGPVPTELAELLQGRSDVRLYFGLRKLNL